MCKLSFSPHCTYSLHVYNVAVSGPNYKELPRGRLNLLQYNGAVSLLGLQRARGTNGEHKRRFHYHPPGLPFRVPCVKLAPSWRKRLRYTTVHETEGVAPALVGCMR